ncbi:MAG: hypothetical protein AAGC55_21770 [Myxococcota bacterium]
MYTFHTAKVWSDLKPISGLGEAILWTATTFCPTVAQRMDRLGVDEQGARDDLAACQRRVAAARPRVEGEASARLRYALHISGLRLSQPSGTMDETTWTSS